MTTPYSPTTPKLTEICLVRGVGEPTLAASGLQLTCTRLQFTTSSETIAAIANRNIFGNVTQSQYPRQHYSTFDVTQTRKTRNPSRSRTIADRQAIRAGRQS